MSLCVTSLQCASAFCFPACKQRLLLPSCMYSCELLAAVQGSKGDTISLFNKTSLAVKSSSFTCNTALSVTVKEMHKFNVHQGAKFRVQSYSCVFRQCASVHSQFSQQLRVASLHKLDYPLFSLCRPLTTQLWETLQHMSSASYLTQQQKAQ